MQLDGGSDSASFHMRVPNLTIGKHVDWAGDRPASAGHFRGCALTCECLIWGASIAGIGPRSAGVIEGAIGTVRNVSGMACRRRREWDFSSREKHAVQQYGVLRYCTESCCSARSAFWHVKWDLGGRGGACWAVPPWYWREGTGTFMYLICMVYGNCTGYKWNLIWTITKHLHYYGSP